ncbi:MAG: protein-L-isoaspartate O-methyltransferase, partial [Hyphomicrobiales bacterium]
MGDFARARVNMVSGQIFSDAVHSARVLDAMRNVMREQFVPAALAATAYADVEVPLDGGRALLMPVTLAKLLQMAEIGPNDLVLDVGCATGYSTAVLARLAGSVVAVESDPGLAAQASETLLALDVDNAAVVQGPLGAGYDAEAPYDVIFLNGSVECVPETLLAQLAPGGRLVAIIGTGRMGRATVITREG